MTWMPRIALALVFVLAGALKFRESSIYVRVFEQIGFGTWFRYFTGIVEIGGGLLLLVPRAAALGFILNGCAMAGAVAFWLFNHNPGAAAVPGVLLLFVIVFGWKEMAALLSGRRTGH